MKKLNIRKFTGFFLGIVVLLYIIFSPTPQTFHSFLINEYSDLDPSMIDEIAYGMKIVSGLLVLMIILWLTEAVPIPITALLPAIILPLFHVNGYYENQIYPFSGKNILANYANPIIYLFLSGFLIARSMQKWGLDKRLTYKILSIGNILNNPKLILLVMSLISAFLSMWISNTATTAMLLPLALGIIKISKQEKDGNFAKAISLSIAYGASIGGVATIIGSPPNGIYVSILKTSGYGNINFLDWMKIGFPLSIILIQIMWLVLLVVFPMKDLTISNSKEFIKRLNEQLGRFSRGELYTTIGFIIVVLLWISNPFWDLFLPEKIAKRLAYFDENIIALFVAISLFFIPIKWKSNQFVLDWNDSKFIDWGTLILFGGGIALSDAMFKTGLAKWIAVSIIEIIGKPSPLIIVLAIVAFIVFLTEVTSNTAVTSMMVPILLSISMGIGIDGKLLGIAAALSASMAFMLPVATPPNALVYGSGYIKISDMIKAGFILNIFAIIFITLILYLVAYQIFGIVKF